MRTFAGHPIATGKRVVLAHGTFDLLHPGHIRYLKLAKEQGDVLFVALSSDEMAAIRKGKERPIQPYAYRQEVLESIRYVSHVIEALHPTHDIYNNLMQMIENEPPDVFVTSYDNFRTNHEERLKELGVKLVVAPIFEGGTTTSIINKITKKLG